MRRDLRELKRQMTKEHKALCDARANWEPNWRDYRKAYAPHRGRFGGERANEPPTTGYRRKSFAYRLAPSFAAGMHGGLTSPTMPWFNLSLFDTEMMERENVKAWLMSVRDKMLGVMIRTNLYEQLTSFYEEEGIFGTAAMYIDDDGEFFHARTLTCGEYAVGTDEKGTVCRAALTRSFSMRQLIEKFGEDALPETLLRQSKEPDHDMDSQRYAVALLIKPSEDGLSDFPFTSYWWIDGIDDHSRPFLRIGGFHEFPIMCARWCVIGDDTYGRGHPGEIGLNDIETLQRVETAKREAIQKMADPPLVADDRILMRGDMDLSPGGITWFDGRVSAEPPVFRNAYQLNFDISGSIQLTEELKADLDDVWYINLFKMWVLDQRQGRTATEINAREQEKMFMLSTVVLRQMSELLGPLVRRVYAILLRKGIFGEVPEELRDMKFQVKYTSVLAKIAEQYSQAGIETVVGYIQNLAQLQTMSGDRPSVIDIIDADQTVQYIAESYNVPTGIIFGDDKLEEIRKKKDAEMEAAKRQAEMMQAASAAPGLARAARDATEAAVAETQTPPPNNGAANTLEMARQALGGMM